MTVWQSAGMLMQRWVVGRVERLARLQVQRMVTGLMGERAGAGGVDVRSLVRVCGREEADGCARRRCREQRGGSAVRAAPTDVGMSET
jgi:hypothetical protein